MKKIISTILVCVLLLGCVMSFTSCSKMLLGKYETEVDAVVAGGKVVYEFTPFGYTKTTTTEVLGFAKDSVEEGKYKITENEDGDLTITFTYEVDGKEETESFSFSQGEEDGVKYVKLGLIKYTKLD